MTAPGIMRRFKMTKIAAVDSPAQKGARMAIMKREPVSEADEFDDSAYLALLKRDFTQEQRDSAAEEGHAMPGGRYPINNASDLENAIHAVGRGKGSHAAIRAHIMRRAGALGAADKIPGDWKASKADTSRVRIALRKLDFGEEIVEKFAERIVADAFDNDGENAALFDAAALAKEEGSFTPDMIDELDQCYRDVVKSVRSIIDDGEADKPALLQETFKQFNDAAQSVVSEPVGPLIGKALGSRSTDTMSLKAIAKALGIDENAPEGDITAAVIKIAKTEQDELKKKFADVLKALDLKEDATPEAIAKQVENFKDKKKKPPFGEDAVDPDEEEEAVTKMVAKGDAFKTADGQVFTKKDFGSEKAFALAKSQAVTIARQADDYAKSEDRRLAAEFAKRAEPLAYIGKADEIGGLLYDIAKFDVKLADKVEAALKTANTRVEKSALFDEKGSNVRGVGGDLSKAAGQIDALARDLLTKEPQLFKNASLDKMAAARAEIRKRQPDLAKQENEEAKQTRKAA